MGCRRERGRAREGTRLERLWCLCLKSALFSPKLPTQGLMLPLKYKSYKVKIRDLLLVILQHKAIEWIQLYYPNAITKPENDIKIRLIKIKTNVYIWALRIDWAMSQLEGKTSSNLVVQLCIRLYLLQDDSRDKRSVSSWADDPCKGQGNEEAALFLHLHMELQEKCELSLQLDSLTPFQHV